jgi:hypothetical protein
MMCLVPERYNWLRKRFYEAMATAGMGSRCDRKGGITFQSLRHTFGTRMAAADVPMGTLQEWMGHRNLATMESTPTTPPTHPTVPPSPKAHSPRSPTTQGRQRKGRQRRAGGPARHRHGCGSGLTPMATDLRVPTSVT